jgi:uncharacterized protein (TIGR03086 family)
MAADVIAGIRLDQLEDATPCARWDVRALISHVISGNLGFAAMIVGEPGPGPGADAVGDDLPDAFRDSFEQLCASFDSPGVLDRVFPTPLGAGPGTLLVALRVTELTVHTWDLMAAAQQARRIDAELVGFVDALLRSQPIPRGANAPFAPERPPPAQATDADRLAAFTGRVVSAWTLDAQATRKWVPERDE